MYGEGDGVCVAGAVVAKACGDAVRKAPEAEEALAEAADEEDDAEPFMALAAKCAPLDTMTRGEPFVEDGDDDDAVKADGADSDSGADNEDECASLSRFDDDADDADAAVATATVLLRAPPMDDTRADHARSDEAASAAALA